MLREEKEGCFAELIPLVVHLFLGGQMEYLLR